MFIIIIMSKKLLIDLEDLAHQRRSTVAPMHLPQAEEPENNIQQSNKVSMHPASQIFNQAQVLDPNVYTSFK